MAQVHLDTFTYVSYNCKQKHDLNFQISSQADKMFNIYRHFGASGVYTNPAGI